MQPWIYLVFKTSRNFSIEHFRSTSGWVVVGLDHHNLSSRLYSGYEMVSFTVFETIVSIDNNLRHLEKNNRLLIRGIILVATGILSALCFWEPNLNAVALMLFSVPASFVITYEGRHCALPEVETFPKRSLTLWGIGFGCWFADRLFCDFWLWIGIFIDALPKI